MACQIANLVPCKPASSQCVDLASDILLTNTSNLTVRPARTYTSIHKSHHRERGLASNLELPRVVAGNSWTSPSPVVTHQVSRSLAYSIPPPSIPRRQVTVDVKPQPSKLHPPSPSIQQIPTLSLNYLLITQLNSHFNLSSSLFPLSPLLPTLQASPLAPSHSHPHTASKEFVASKTGRYMKSAISGLGSGLVVVLGCGGGGETVLLESNRWSKERDGIT